MKNKDILAVYAGGTEPAQLTATATNVAKGHQRQQFLAEMEAIFEEEDWNQAWERITFEIPSAEE